MSGVGNLVKHYDVMRVVREEEKIHPRRRQVVSILLIEPSGKRLCLCQHENSLVDGFCKVSPPQGGVERRDSTVFDVVRRELAEELNVIPGSPVVYLGSDVRVLAPSHGRATSFDEYHHHWVTTFAPSYTLKPEKPISKADWYHFDALSSMSSAMSAVKWAMFKAALDKLFAVSGDRLLVRKEHLLAA